MFRGLDTAESLLNKGPALVKDGYKFVCRYYNINNPSKNLSLLEAKNLSSNGIYIIPVWENGYPVNERYFTPENGTKDAQNAYMIGVNIIHQPEGSEIYFAVDFDPNAEEIQGPILNYFHAIRIEFQRHWAMKNMPKLKIGIYGSGLACRFLKLSGIIEKTWLAQSTGWGGYNDYFSWNLKQGKSFIWNGLDCDENISDGKENGFLLK